MNTISNRGKTYTSGGTIQHQDDVISSVKPYSVWQGYVIAIVGLIVIAVLWNVVLPYIFSLPR